MFCPHSSKKMSRYSDGEVPESVRVKRRRVIGRRQQRVAGVNQWGRPFQAPPKSFVVDVYKNQQYRRWRHRQIVIVNNPNLDKQLSITVVKAFQQLNFQVYDHMFPFRLAGGMIGRYGSHRCKMLPLVDTKDRNDFEQCLADFAEEYMREKHGDDYKYAFEAFENWLESSANSTHDIVICGMLSEEYAPIAAKYNAEVVDAQAAKRNIQQFREYIWQLQENHARVYK